MEKAQANVSDDQVNAAAHALSDKTWEAHIYFGYALALLLLLTMISKSHYHAGRLHPIFSFIEILFSRLVN